MSCSPFDLRDYFFGELPEEDRQQVDLHSRTCGKCREELSRLRSTQAALLAVADEEIPQRIGFVSDRVYEPSRLRRWWLAFWESAPRLGFASAAMLSAAIIVSAMHRPAVVAPPAPTASVDVVKLQADFSRQLNEAVEKAVAESDARHAERTAQLLTAAAKRFDGERRADIEQVSQRFAILEKYYRRELHASIVGDGPQ
jgi:anti-sigma factor RsiW